MSAEEDSVALHANMEDSEPDEKNAIPKSTTRKKMKPRIQPLKRKATGPTNTGITARKINISLNNSVVKQTLRSNNRSLARALEMATQEYSVLQQQFVALQTHQIDCERRMKKRLTDVRAVLEVVSSKLATSVSLLDEAQALCTVDQDFDSTMLTPNTDAPPEIPDIRPRPAPQRCIITASTNQQEDPEVPAAIITNTKPTQSPTLTDDESPSRSLDEGGDDTGALGEVIENMKADITHVMTSLQGYRAAPVSMPPADMSMVMEMSYLMDQLPPMFDEVEQDVAEKGPSRRERGHSRSRSGRRSTMIYRAGGSLTNLATEADPADQEEKGPRRSLRARSRSRQRPRKTYNEEEEEELTIDAVECSKKTGTDQDVEAADVPTLSEPQTEVAAPEDVAEEDAKSSTDEQVQVTASQEPQMPTVIYNDHLMKVFVPKNEIPRTPPSRRASPSPEEPEEIEPETCPVPLPKFISFVNDTSTKGTKKRLSVPKKKVQKNLVAQTKKGKKPVINPMESQPTKSAENEEITSEKSAENKEITSEKSAENKEITPEKTILSEHVLPTTKDLDCSEAPVEPEVTEEEVNQNNPSSQKTEAEHTEVIEAVTLPVPEPKTRRSHLRRGTITLATQVSAVVEAAAIPQTLRDAESSERPRRQRRGTFCMTETDIIKDPHEEIVPESPKEAAADNTEREQTRQEQRQKRGTFFVPTEQKEEDIGVDGKDSEEDIVNEQEITLIYDRDDYSDDLNNSTTCADDSANNKFVDVTKYEEEDMELTEVINFAAFNLENKFPVPSFIRKEQNKVEKEDSVTDEKTMKETTKSHGKLVLKPKLRKRERGGKEADVVESKSEMCSTEESSTSKPKADKKQRGKDVDYDESKEENKSEERSVQDSSKSNVNVDKKKRRGKDDVVESKSEMCSAEESSTSKPKADKRQRGKDVDYDESKEENKSEERSVQDSSKSNVNVDKKKRRGKDDVVESKSEMCSAEESSTSKPKADKRQRGKDVDYDESKEENKSEERSVQDSSKSNVNVDKKKRRGKDDVVESKSEMCSAEESSTSKPKADKRQRGKDVDYDESKEENKSEERSVQDSSKSKVNVDKKKTRGKDDESKADNNSVEELSVTGSSTSKDGTERKRHVRKNTVIIHSKSSEKEEDQAMEETSALKENVDKKKLSGKDSESHDAKAEIGTYLFADESYEESSASKENARGCKNVVEILDSNVDSEDAFKKPDMRLIKPLAKVKAAASKVQTKHHESSSETSSDSDKEIPKFQTMSARPGKIVFKAGRKKVEDLKPGTQKGVNGKSSSKVKSLLPRPDRPRSKTARSKTRLLSLDKEMKLGFTQEEKKVDGPPKSVFDMSLNESITVLPQMRYGDFREQNPAIEAMKEALKSNQNGEALPDTGEHGIMLVMGNGKRTKPRVRSKSVTYSRKLAEVHLRPPSASSSSDGEAPQNVRENAGKTPPKRKMKPELPKSDPKDSEPIDDLKDEETLIPDTPDIKITKKAKRAVKSKDSAPKPDSLANSGRDLFCSIRSSVSSVVNDSAIGETDSQSSSMPAPSGTTKTQPKKRLSLAKPKEDVVVRASPRNSAKKSTASTKVPAKTSVPVDRTSTSSTSSTTKRSLIALDDFKMPFDEVEPKRARRGVQVSYKEPTLNAKMRRGDPRSSSVYKEGDHKTIKDRKSEKRSRSVLTTITNIPLDDN